MPLFPVCCWKSFPVGCTSGGRQQERVQWQLLPLSTAQFQGQPGVAHCDPSTLRPLRMGDAACCVPTRLQSLPRKARGAGWGAVVRPAGVGRTALDSGVSPPWPRGCSRCLPAWGIGVSTCRHVVGVPLDPASLETALPGDPHFVTESASTQHRLPRIRGPLLVPGFHHASLFLLHLA